MPAPPPIPERRDDLTAEWCTAALRAGGTLTGGRVTDVDTEPVGTGQMGESTRVRLTYDGPDATAPASVVVKLASADPQSRATGLTLRAYEIEVRFYQQVAPVSPVRTPACHYADVDTTTGAFVLVLEDLAPARTGDQLAGCTVDDAAAAIVELVHLHAPRWGDPALESLPWLHRTSDTSIAMGEQILPMLFAGFRDRYADRLDDEIVAVGERLVPSIGRYLRGQPRPWTIQHGDFRLDNLLFGGHLGGRVAVLDWQTAIHGAGLVDVAYFLGASLTTELRRAHERDLLRNYHDRLVAAGVAGYDWDRCLHDYRRATFAGYVMAMSASMLVERTDRGDEMFLTMARRHGRHVLDLDAHTLLEG